MRPTSRLSRLHQKQSGSKLRRNINLFLRLFGLFGLIGVINFSFLASLALVASLALSTFPLWAGCGVSVGAEATPGAPTLTNIWASTATITVPIGSNTNDLCFYVIRATWTLDGTVTTNYVQTSGLLGASTAYLQDVGPDANFPKVVSGLNPGTTLYISAAAADDSNGTDLTPYGVTTSTVTRPGVAVAPPTQANTWQSDSRFYFRPFFDGAPIADNYQFKWDQSSSVWDGTSQDGATASAANSTRTATAVGDWYFHARFRNTAGTVLSYQDLGPFKFDNALPSVSNVECRQRDGSTWTACSNAINISTPTIRHDVQDSNSGIVIGEQALGISSGTMVYLNFDNWPPADTSGFNRAITVSGATENTGGRFGSAMQATADGQYVRISTMSQLVGATQMSVEMWFYKTLADGAVQVPWSFSNGGSDFGLQLQLDMASTAGGLQFTNESDEIDLATPKDQFNPNSPSWHYAVATFNDTTNEAVIYLNGREIARKTATASPTFNRDFYIGAYPPDSTFSFQGRIDEFRITNRIVTPEEVAANFFSGARKFTRDGGSNWIIDPSTYTATGAVSTTGSTGDTVARKATGIVNFDNAHATNNQFLYLIRDRAGNVATTATTVNIPYTAASFTSVQAEPKDGQGFTASESGGSITVNDITPNIRFTAQAQGPAPLRISSSTISISSDTVLYLDFEEWPPLDKSGYGNHPNQISGNPSQTGSGMRGSGLSVDTNDFLSIPSNTSFNAANQTFITWMKTSDATNNNRPILSRYTAGGSGSYMVIFRRSGCGVDTGICLFDNNTYYGGFNDNLADSVWHMVAVVVEGTTARFYLDGRSTTTVTVGALGSRDDSVYIGGNPSFGTSFNGTIDEIKIVKRAMTDEEIRLEYNASHLEISRDGGATWITTNTFTNNNLEISGSPRTSFGADVLTSTQTAFFQEHATNNQIRLKVMDAIGNITTSSAYTVNIVAANPALSNDQIADSQGSFSSGIASQWTNTLSPKTRFTSVQDSGSGLASRAIDNRTILYLPFDEGSGTTATDISSTSALGTLKGNTLPTWTTGVFGSALNFNGGYIEVSTMNVLNSVSALTLQFWMKMSPYGAPLIVFGKDDGSTATHPAFFGGLLHPSIGIGTLPSVPFIFTRAGGYQWANTRVDDGQWHLLTYANDGSTTKFYIDGRLDASVTQSLKSGTAINSKVLEIGRDRTIGWGGLVNTVLDEFQIYNYSRSADEVAADWRRGINRIHQVEVSTNSGTNYYTVEAASVAIDGVDGSLAVQTLTADMPASVCPPDWVTYPGSRSCYKWFSADSTGWAQGRDVCIAEGGDLVKIDSTQENDFVLRSGSYGSSTPFLGINDQTLEGTYAWADGSAVTYTNWKSGQPVNNAAIDCVVFEAFSTGTWSTDTCTAQRSPICEKPAAPFAEGSNNRLRVNVYDQSGRVGQSTYTVNVDITAPLPPTLAMSEPLGWPQISTMPIAMAVPGTVIWNKRLYVLGGLDTSNTGLNRIFYAPINNDGSLGSWTEETTNRLPAARNVMGVATYNGRIYVVGGYTDFGTGAVQTVWYASLNSNGSLGAWSTGPNFPVAGGASAAILNGFLYARSGSNVVGSTMVYVSRVNTDGSLDSWRSAGYPVPAVFGGETLGMVAFRDTVYLMNGGNAGFNDVFYAKVVDSDGKLGPWTNTNDTIPNAGEGAGLTLFNNRALVIGGATNSTKIRAGAIDSAGALTWSTYSVDISTGRYRTNAVAYGNKVYLVGGSAETGTRPYQPSVLMGDFSFTGVSSPANGQLKVDFSAAAADKSGGSGLHSTPNRVEVSTSSDCSGTTTYDSGYSAATSFTGTSLSTSTPYFVRAWARDTALNSQSNSCLGPFWPQDNAPPVPPALSEVTFSTWTAPFMAPYASRFQSVAISKNRVYLTGGQISGINVASAHVAEINSSGIISTWTATTSLPVSAVEHGSLVFNDRLYVVSLGGVYFTSINSDGTLSSWTQTTSLPKATYSPSVFVFNGRIYAIGGGSGSALEDVWYTTVNADGTLGSWAQTTSLPSGVYGASSALFGNKIYVMGSSLPGSARVYYATINQDGTISGWSRTTDMPYGPYFHASVVLNNRVYILGGSTQLVYSAGINSDGALGSWSQHTNLPSASVNRSGVSAFVFNNKIYFLGGSTTASEVFVASVTLSGITFPAHQQVNVSLASGTSDYISAHATPNRAELFTTLACTGTAVYDSSWSAATSFAATGVSTSSAHYLQVRGRDATGLESSNGCFGPFYPQDNTPPVSPTMAEVFSSTWTQTTSLPAVRHIHSSVIYNNKIYTAGGHDGSTHHAEVYFASISPDGVISAWTAVTSLPAVRTYHTSIVYNNRIYIIGGLGQPTVYTAPINADGTLGSWSQTTSLPDARNNHSSVIYNNRIYTIGGHDGSAVHAEVYSAPINPDGTLGSWAQTTSLPAARYYHSSVIYNNRIYTIAGADNLGVPRAEVYSAPINTDGTLGAWTQTTSLPDVRYVHSSVIFNNKIYTIGGSAQSTVYTAPINADGTLGSWSQTTSLPAGRQYHSSVISNNRIYTIGGHDGSAVRAEVFVASVTLSGITFPAHQQVNVSLASGTSDYISAHATPNRAELFTTLACTGTAVYDSSWSAATSFAATGVSTSSAHYLQVRGRDATGLESSNGCFGPYYPQDNSAPRSPTLTEVLPSTWTATASLPAVRFFQASAVHNNRIYVTGGADGPTTRGEVYYAPINPDGTITSWSQAADLPGTRSKHVSLVHNDRLYIVGGALISGDGFSVRFAPLLSTGGLGSWTATTGLPVDLEKHTSVIYNNRIYVIGGVSSTAYKSEVYYAQINSDGTLGSWQLTTPLPGPRAYHTTVLFGNKVYVIGGYDGTAYKTTVYFATIRPDGTLSDWIETQNIPISLGNYAAGVINGRVYIASGYGNAGWSNAAYSAPINADGTLGSWSQVTGANLPIARYHHSSVVFGNRIFIIGGVLNLPGEPATADVLVASVTLSGISTAQAGDLSFSFSTSSDAFSSLDASPHWVEASTNSYCEPTFSNSGWFSGTSKTLTLSGGTSYYARLRGRDSTGLVSDFNGCYGPTYVSRTIFVTISSVTTPTTVAQGSRGALAKLEIYTQSSTSSWTTLNLSKLGTLTDADVKGVGVCVDNGDGSFDSTSDPCPFDFQKFTGGIATVTISGTQADLNTSTKTYFVVAEPDSLALPTNTIGVSIAGAGSFSFSTDHRSNVNAPFNSRLLTVSDGASQVTVTPTSLAPTTIAKGRTNTAFLKMRVEVNQGTSELKEFLLKSSGTAVASDVSVVKVYRDDGDGSFSAAGDTLLGPSTSTFTLGYSTYAFTASQTNKTIRAGTPAQLFLVFDVAQGAQTSNTLGIALDATSYFRLQGSSDTIAAANFPMTSSPLSIISEPHNLYELWENRASTSVLQGATQAMGKLRLWTDKAVATVNSLRVELKTGEFDSAVTRVYFYQDSGSGEFEASADTQLSSATFSGRIANLSFTQQTIDTSTRTYFVVYEVNPTAIQDQTVTLNIASGYLGITTSDSVEALNPSPFISTSSRISPTTDTMLLSKASSLSKLSVDQGKSNFLVANLKTVMGSGGGVWTGLKVTKQGSTPDADFDRVSVWKDNDNDRVFTSTGDAVVGFQENTQSGVFINRAVTVDFTESQNLDTTTRYYYLTASMDANAVVGSTFSFIVVSTSDIKMSAPDFAVSVNLPLMSDAIDVTQFQNTIIANFISSAPATVAVADRGVLIGKLRFYSDLNNVSFSSLRLDRLGTASDSDIARVYLREDTNASGSFEDISDAVVSSGTFTDGTLQFASLSKTILSGSASAGGSSFFITVDVSSAATPERTFQLRLLDKNYVSVAFPNQVSSTTFPLNAGSVTIKPPPVTVYGAPESLAPTSALKGTTDVPIARVRLWSNWFSAQLSKVRVNLIGTAEDADIARVKIIYDLNGNGTCCQGDSLVTSGSDAFTKGVAEISFASAQTITTSTKTYFVLFDLSSQASQKTAGVGINAGNYFSLDSPNALSETNLPFASGLVTITPTVAGLLVTPGDLAPTFVVQGSTNVLFSRLALQTTAYSLSLQGLTLNKIGTLDDAQISNVRVWLDANKDNVIGSTETALTSGTRQFANSKIALLFTSPVTIDTSGSQILVALDISRTASLNATVGVRLAQAGDVTVDSPNFAVPSGYPMSSSTSPVRDLGDTVSMSLTDISNREIGQGKTNQPVVKLQASANEDSATLTEIRVDKTGDLADSHISLLKIFRDNGNAEWDSATTETLVATAAISGAIGRLSLSETVTTSTKTYFIAVDISSQATVAAKFGLNIAGNLYVKAASPDTVKDFSNFLTADISIRDLKTPAIPAVADGGKYTYLATKLTATFSSSVEEGTITECEYGVGTTTATPSVRDWTSAGTQTSVDIAGLSLSPGTTYYVLTRCKTNLGFTSTIGFSDGILVDSVKPTFSAAPAVQAEGQNVVCSWTKPSHGESGVTLYKVEERRADTPVWNPVVNVSTSGARALGGYSVMAQPAQSGGGVITSSQLQVVIQNKTSGTYYYRVLAESGAGQWSDASGETRVVLGIGSQSEVIANLRAYPNPVDTRKKSATIYYDLNQNSDVEIKIFDLFGKEVITLNFSSGSEGGKQGGNSVSWNGESEKGEKVSFGAYLLKVRAKATGDVKKYKLGVIH